MKAMLGGGPEGSLGSSRGVTAKRMLSRWSCVTDSRFFRASRPKLRANLRTRAVSQFAKEKKIRAYLLDNSLSEWNSTVCLLIWRVFWIAWTSLNLRMSACAIVLAALTLLFSLLLDRVILMMSP